MAEAVEIITDEETVQEPQGWSQIWQLPALIVGVLLFGIGVYVALPEAEENQFAGVLDEVGLYLKARNLEEAQSVLKISLEPFIGRAPIQDQATYYLHWGDLVYLQQEANNWDKYENHQRVLWYYQKSKEMGMALGPMHLQRLAETYVALKRDTEAMDVLDQLKDAPARRRYQVVKQIVERRRESGADAQDLAALMARFDNELREETDKETRREQQMWSVGLQAQGLLDVNEPEKSIQYLQRQMINFMAEGGDDDLAGLRILLAKAFQRLGEHEDAQRWYRLAQQKLESVDVLNADVLVGLAQIDLAVSGDVRAALENFSVAEMEYPTAPAYIDALVGRADCEARLGAHPESIEHFGQAVKVVVEDFRRRPDKLNPLVTAVHSHFDLNAARQEYELALRYLSLLKPVYRDEMPPKVLLEFAAMHEQIADKTLAAFEDEGELEPGMGLGGRGDPSLVGQGSGAFRLAMQEAAVHYATSGDFYFKHAHAVTGIDDDAFGRSLWTAAVSYDKAQLWEKAIAVYAEYMKARPEDPRQLEAINHLGLAYQSDGQYATAAGLFKRLVDEHKHTPEAYKSLVPLARCHIALNEFDDAERVLLYVVTDHPAITPVSTQYRQALIELGKLYYQIGRYEQAIARLTEAVDRYGQTRQGAALRFRLADAYRLSVTTISQTLEQAMPQSKTVTLRAERARRLEQAQVLFSQVISEMEAMDASVRSPIEKLYLRNAFFYRADCAYDLGRYEQAISLYDLAAKRWETHPASLVALVQIVNAYCELGRTQEAKVANDRARWQLKRIPDDAFDDPTLPMTREHWQDWLRWTSELNLFGSQANAASGSGGGR